MRKSNAIFFESVIPFLKNKNFDNFICCELELDGTKLKKIDKDWKIDWLTTFEEELVGIAARVSSFNGFTIRKYSRGYQSEYFQIPNLISKKDFPINPDNFYVFQIETTEVNNKKIPTKLHVIKTSSLFSFVKENENKVECFTNKSDGNEFVFVSVETLLSNKIKHWTIDLTKGIQD